MLLALFLNIHLKWNQNVKTVLIMRLRRCRSSFGCVSGVEQRHAVLQAVRQRYLSDGLCRVSEIRVMERAPLCAALGVLPAAWGEAVAGGAERTGADGGAELLLLPASSSQGRLDR